MDIETRLKNIENLVDYLTKMVAINKHYTDADIAGTRLNISAITPYTETKTAYYGESEKTFYDVPYGRMSVYFTNYDGDYSVSRVSGRLTISFDTLTEQTDITISIQ